MYSLVRGNTSMKNLLVAFAFLALPVAAWADEDEPLPTRLTLDEPRDEAPKQAYEKQDPEAPRQQAPDSMTIIEYTYRHSELELGVLYTQFGTDLKLDNELGYYLRWGVGLLNNVSVNLTYRY